MLLKEFPALSNLELYRCSTIKSQLSYESVQTGVTIKYQSLKTQNQICFLTPATSNWPFCFLFISSPEEAISLVFIIDAQNSVERTELPPQVTDKELL